MKLFLCSQQKRPSARALGLFLLTMAPIASVARADEPAGMAEPAHVEGQTPRTYEGLSALANELSNAKEEQEARRILLLAFDLAPNALQRASTQFSIGASFMREKHFAEARKWFDKVKGHRNLVNSARTWAAQSYIREKDYTSAEKAGKELLQAPDMDLNAKIAWWSIAQALYSEHGRFEDSYRILAEALAEKELPQSNRDYFERALKAVQMREEKKTGKLSPIPPVVTDQTANANAPANSNQPLTPDNPANADQMVETNAPTTTNPPAEENLNEKDPGRAYLPFDDLGIEANKLYVAKDYEGARRIFMQCLDQAPNVHERSRVLSRIAGTYFTEKNYDQARSWWQKASDVPGIHRYLAMNPLGSIAGSYITQSNYPAAIKVAQNILRDPRARLIDWVDAWRTAHSGYNMQRQYEQCFQVLEEALAEKGLSTQDRADFESMLKSDRILYQQQQRRRN